MKKITLSFVLLAALVSACNSYQKTDSGIEYKMLDDNTEGNLPNSTDILLVNMRMSVLSTDSVLMETFTTGQKQNLPVNEPTLNEVFELLSAGDSVDFNVNADTLFQKSFQMPTPEWIKPGERIRFVIKVEEVLTAEDMNRKRQEQLQSFKELDETNLKAYIAGEKNIITTPSGLMYVVQKEGSGKSIVKGNKVSMLYKGYFMNGEVFDENQRVESPFTFTVGLQQVIPGWDEGALYMKKGGKYKLIVPWNLAYGDRGAGPIMPYTSLIFEVEVLNAE
jgi:FKBP-type peptidyl-prolyl cis-trans isomerase